MELLNKYYVYTIAPFDGDHIVHREDCPQLPLLEHCMWLGEFSHCKLAVIIAKKTYKLVSGCKACAPACANHSILN